MNRSTPRSFLIGIALAIVAVGNSQVWAATSLTSPLPISEIPLIVPIRANPQVLFALTDSQSMDGDLSGAIFTGSGDVASGAASGLTISSSPVNYTVPTGFTAPVTGTAAGASAAYTVISGSTETDNSASRLNEAKQGIQAIIAAYASNTSFALEDYNASTGGATYTTWVYQMSGSPHFTFDNIGPPAVPAGGLEYVLNPCYGYTTSSASVKTDCGDILTSNIMGNLATLTGDKWMLVAQSSDDADVNDVLYASGESPVCATYGGPSPPTPFPPNRTLGQYNANNGQTDETYTSGTSTCAQETGPTNAGFVPYSPQVMYEQRGFGFDGRASATTGTIVVGNPSIITAGSTPTSTSIAAVNAAFATALAPETNNANSSEVKALAEQAPIAGLMSTALTYFKSSAVTTTGTGNCATQQSVILVTDGLPTQDLNSLAWPPLGSAAGVGYGVTATFNANGSLASTNDQALTDAIAKITALKAAGINVYVIGMGAGVNSAANPLAQQSLTAMAYAGGTGTFFPASSVTALVADLNSILGSIENAKVSNGSLPVLGPRLTGSSLTYQSSFAVNGTDWTGDLDAYALSTTGTAATLPTWDAKALLNSTSPGSRNIFTDLTAGTAAGSNTTAVAFTAAAIGTTQAAQLAFLGFPPLIASQYTGALAQPTDMVNYLRGDQTNDQGTTGTYRTRSSILGDIVDSVPVVSNDTDDYGYGNLSVTDGGTTYEAFVLSKKTRTPKTMIYVGANDGMLHGFDGALGTEEFGFIPNSVASNLGLLLNPFYVHQFYVDGPITVGDAFLASNWQTVLVGTPGAGGSGLFALNVTTPSSVSASSVLWELTSTASPYMGYDLGQAQIILGEDDNWYAIVGNGYNSANSAPALFVISLATGKIAATLVATDPDTSPTPGNGIGQIAAADLLTPSPPATAIGPPDGKVDTVYAGDYDGNVWKFDLSSASGPAAWAVANGGKPLFTATDSSGNRQPITGNFELAPGPLGGVMVYFGTGSYFLVGDNLLPPTPKVQTVYGVWDDPNVASGTTATRSNLVAQKITASETTTPVTRTTSANPVAYTIAAASPRGFYMDLEVGSATSDQLGEEFFGTPVVQSGIIFFTTFTPQAGTGCSNGGINFLYGLSALTGANALSPVFAAGGSGICTSGGCGGVQLGGSGSSPVSSPSIVVPPPPCAAGAACNSTIPAKPCNWDGQNPGCTNPTEPTIPNASQCTIVILAPGAPAMSLYRGCGRQSWRQVR